MAYRSTRAKVVLASRSSSGNDTHSRESSECCIVSSELWEALLLSRRKRRRQKSAGVLPDGILCIAITLPRDRRVEDDNVTLGNVIVWAKLGDDGEAGMGGRSLLINPSFFPRHVSMPESVLLDIHDPIPLTLAILQPITTYDGYEPPSLDENDLDLSSFISSLPSLNGLPNGSNHSHPTNAPPIIRQSQELSLPISGENQRFRLLMLEPVLQGFITPSTQIIISKTPYTPPSPHNELGHAPSETSRISMVDFDPDAFLSASLEIQSLSSDGREEMWGGESSVTSGSVTPRQGGRSPIAAVGVLPDLECDRLEMGGNRFSVVSAFGSGTAEGHGGGDKDVCWLGVGSLGRSGIFDGDWVLLTAVSSGSTTSERLVRAIAWEYLDEEDCKLPENTIILPPALHRSLFPSSNTIQHEVILTPTPFGVRTPTLPIARSVTVARVATAEGVNKRYERSWLKGIGRAFTGGGKGKGKLRESPDDGTNGMLLRRGDIIPVPIWVDRLVSPEEEDERSDTSDSDEDDHPQTRNKSLKPTSIAYFQVISLNFEPLIPLEEDFRSSISSKARAGEYGCWVDTGRDGATRLVLEGLERVRIASRGAERSWYGVEGGYRPVTRQAETRLGDLLGSCFARSGLSYMIQLSVLIKGGRGAGKTSLVRYVADELGYNVVTLDCYDIVGDTQALTQGSILAAAEKAKSCSPSILLLQHVEALAKKSESSALGKQSSVVKVLEDLVAKLREASVESGFPCVLVGTTGDADAVPGDVLGVFKQEVSISSPNEAERVMILQNCMKTIPLAPDVTLKSLSSQTAALSPLDISAFLLRASDLALQRAMSSSVSSSAAQVKQAGISITAADVRAALGEARASYADSIGAPKIPDVKWEDVGGLQSVKREILDTVQLPLDRPELFAEGLKKRSGILLYGPPGTGKTLLAKAVATSCSLNFLSVKGPELLNMYIGESEANVRRIFQRARDASPCLIFMDELDSVAPKRGNQGDSGGVMDRIVSQLLAELDGMSGGDGEMVFVMGATNRPDLLDPALLRPGRFDRMLYLSVATTHEAQYDILRALTRKFELEDGLDLEEIAGMCPFNYTGADFYALCSDAMLGAMTRKAEAVEERIKVLDGVEDGDRKWPVPLTPQFYLGSMASKEEIEVRVGREDFVEALRKLIPSVSRGEMEHYERVQAEFKGFEIGKQGNGI